MAASFLAKGALTVAVLGAAVGGAVMCGTAVAATATPAVQPSFANPFPGEHKIYGTVQSVRGTVLVIRTRTGRPLVIDGRSAHTSVVLTLNRPVFAFGTIDALGIMHARGIWRTFSDATHWPADQ